MRWSHSKLLFFNTHRWYYRFLKIYQRKCTFMCLKIYTILSPFLFYPIQYRIGSVSRKTRTRKFQTSFFIWHTKRKESLRYLVVCNAARRGGFGAIPCHEFLRQLSSQLRIVLIDGTETATSSSEGWKFHTY